MLPEHSCLPTSRKVVCSGAHIQTVDIRIASEIPVKLEMSARNFKTPEDQFLSGFRENMSAGKFCLQLNQIWS